VATALSSVGRRPADLAARYGGEEFAMILPGTVAEGAVDVAQSVSRVIAGLAITHARSGTGQFITLSQGIVSLVPEQETSPEDLILRADKALYQAKEQGRNRYVVFGGK
jgi:diguanylate cyclase